MIPPLDEWDVEEEQRNPRGCALAIAASLVVWLAIMWAVRHFWGG